MAGSDQSNPGLFEKLTAFLPLFWLSLAFLSGILLASTLQLNPLRWLLLAGLALLAALSIRLLRHHRSSPILFLLSLSLVALFLGAARYRITLPRLDEHNVAWYNDDTYELLVTGTLVDPPDRRDSYTNLRLQTTQLELGTQTIPVSGLVLARIPPGGDWQYGQVLRLRGHLETPPESENFSYQDYLAHQGILTYMPDAQATLLPFTAGNPLLRLVYTFKAYAVTVVYRIFPEPEASLLAGILLGDDNGLPAALQQAYKNTGTAHIIAISGFNIAILAGLFVTLFSRLLGRRKGALFAVIGIAIYTVLVGAGASVLRAAIMGTLALFARQVGRRQNGLNTLAFTGALMAAISPHVLWDVGFQLSFAATLGLILYAAPFEQAFARLLSRRMPVETARRIAAPIGEFLLFTLAAQLTTLPIMAYQFGRISLVALIANPFILPVQPPVMILGGLALLLGLIYLPLGKLAGWIAWPFAAYTDRAVQFFNGFPHGVIVLGEFSLVLVVLFYVLLLSITLAGPVLKKVWHTALAPSVIIAVLGISTYLVWTAIFASPDGNLHLTFFDVGTADAIFIQTPAGRTLLIDGGSSPSTLSEALGSRLSPFDRRLDWLVVASPQESQLAALPPLLDRFPVSGALWSGNPAASYSAGQVQHWLGDNGTPLTLATPATILDLGQGARLEVRSVSPRGAVLLLEWQGFRALLPVGMNLDTLAELENGRKIGPVTLLLLADSGLGQLNPTEWLANLHPQTIVLSVAAGDPDGLPDQSVLDALSGASILRTDRNGWIEVSTNGTGYWIDVERK